MKKRIFGAFVVVAIAVGAMINVNLNKVGNSTSDLAFENMLALASGEGSVETCDIKVYNRNYMEDFVTKTDYANTDFDGYFTYGGVKFGPFGCRVSVKFSYDGGVCVSSPGNCCLKSHIYEVRKKTIN